MAWFIISSKLCMTTVAKKEQSLMFNLELLICFPAKLKQSQTGEFVHHWK